MKRVNPAIEENVKIYSGVFFPNGLHMTYDYRGGTKGHPVIPFDMEQGQICYVFIENITFTELFVAAQVYFYITPDHKVTVQYDESTPLHITLHTAKGVNPAISGQKLMEYLDWNNGVFFNTRTFIDNNTTKEKAIQRLLFKGGLEENFVGEHVGIRGYWGYHSLHDANRRGI